MKESKPFCNRMRGQFDDYHDGTLSALLSGVVRKHLTACAPCRREYALLQMTIEAVRQKSAPDVPPRLLRKIISEANGPGGGTPVPREEKSLDWWDGLQNT